MKYVLDSDNHLYLFALGKFVSQFSLVESVIFIYLANLLKMERNEFNAITSGAKIDLCCSYIKRVHEARQIEIPANILECLERLSSITKLRNDLLHRGADADFVVTNEVRALPGRIESYKVSPALLQAATVDLTKIMFNFAASMNVNFVTDRQERANEIKDGSWRFKSPSVKKISTASKKARSD